METETKALTEGDDFAPVRAFLETKEGAQPPTVEEVCALINPQDVEAARRQLEEWELDGRVVISKKNRVGFPGRWGMAAGKVQRSPKGFAFLLPVEEDGEECFIPAEDLGGALHGDTVLCSVGLEPQPGRKRNASVIRILRRGVSTVVGSYEEDEYGGYVVSDDERFGVEVNIAQGLTLGAQPGEKVVCTITAYPDTQEDPLEGAIVEVLGPAGEKGVDILSIIRQQGLPDAFPQEVEAEAKAVARAAESEDTAGRRDLRDWMVITVDGADSKDLDDAISLDKLPEGGWRLGVHIADVSQRVQPGSSLDKEAYNRGTSVYLLDRVIPMLPTALSNGICSLNQGVDRACLSCVMTLDAAAEIVDFEVFESVIRSSGRLVYDTVDAALAGDAAAVEAYAPYMALLQELKAMTDRRYALRRERGTLQLDIPEPVIRLDETGFPVEIEVLPEGPSHQVIEECMLCANETIAAWMEKEGVPMLYRAHEAPDPEKMADLSLFVTNFGLRNPGLASGVTPKKLQQVLDFFEGKPEAAVVRRVLLRSLAKARYDGIDRGHFGLAAEHYCHFTSPIRRYPDLVVHRAVKRHLHGTDDASWRNAMRKRLDAMAEQCTQREILAMQAERAVDDLKMAEYMTRHIDEEFDGVISGVTEFGIFVELPNTIEGLVHVSTLQDDFYIFDEKNYSLMGRTHRKVYRMGDPIRIRVVKADVSARRVDFELAGEERGSRRRH